MESSKYAEDIRTTIRHENELINHRISWMATFNGFLFTALGFVWGKPDGKALTYMLAGVGIATCVSAYFSLHLATTALGRLRKLWADKEIKDADVPPVSGWDQPLGLRWLLPWNTLPWVFAAAWAGIIAITALVP